MTMLSEMGINVIESEESEESTNEEQPEAAAAPATTPATVDEDDLGRTDDPVRMYLREMGSVEAALPRGRDRHRQAHRGRPADHDRRHLREPADHARDHQVAR